MSIKQYLKRAITFIIKGIPEKKISAEISMLPLNQLLSNRIAIITGGSSGIGFSIAQAFLNSGASVVITGRNQEKLDLACSKLNLKTNSGNKAYGITLDNTDINTFESKFAQIQNLFPNQHISILVNNAGVLGGEISIVKESQYDDILNTNLKGCFFLSQLFGKYLIKNDIKGNILNIASSSSLRPASSAYTISKWGIRGFTLGLAKNLAPYGITVNGLAPGPTATPMLSKAKDDNLYFANNPIGRFALPEEIANMAVILTSNLGKTIVGDIIYMTGGAGLITFDDIKYNF